MARKLSAVTRAKISRSLKGNDNAKKAGTAQKLSARQKVANIQVRTAAKKSSLTPEQVARRAGVAKRLRSQARREESLGAIGPKASIPKAGSSAAQSNLNPVNRVKNMSDERARRAQKKSDQVRSAKAQRTGANADVVAARRVQRSIAISPDVNVQRASLRSLNPQLASKLEAEAARIITTKNKTEFSRAVMQLFSRLVNRVGV